MSRTFPAMSGCIPIWVVLLSAVVTVPPYMNMNRAGRTESSLPAGLIVGARDAARAPVLEVV
jgi:hypothetical protein